MAYKGSINPVEKKRKEPIKDPEKIRVAKLHFDSDEDIEDILDKLEEDEKKHSKPEKKRKLF